MVINLVTRSVLVLLIHAGVVLWLRSSRIVLTHVLLTVNLVHTLVLNIVTVVIRGTVVVIVEITTTATSVSTTTTTS